MRLAILLLLGLLFAASDVVSAVEAGSEATDADEPAGGDKDDEGDEDEEEEESGTKGWGKNFNEITKGADGKMTVTFASIDTDSDEKLSPDEFMAALKQVNPTASEGTMRRQQKAFFKKADKVKESSPAFCSFVLTFCVCTYSQNKDGFIVRKENVGMKRFLAVPSGGQTLFSIAGVIEVRHEGVLFFGGYYYTWMWLGAMSVLLVVGHYAEEHFLTGSSGKKKKKR
jgi:hypothetical protein